MEHIKNLNFLTMIKKESSVMDSEEVEEEDLSEQQNIAIRNLEDRIKKEPFIFIEKACRQRAMQEKQRHALQKYNTITEL